MTRGGQIFASALVGLVSALAALVAPAAGFEPPAYEGPQGERVGPGEVIGAPEAPQENLSALLDGELPGLKRAINDQVRGALRVSRAVSVRVEDIATGFPVYDYNGAEPRILASNTKLFTAAAALDLFGPGYFLETPFLARGTLVDGVLDGDLAVVGGGDPNLSGRHRFGDSLGIFREWGSSLHRLGVERVTGGIYLVDGLFDDLLVHPDWPRDQLHRWYEAPVSALAFNDNCILVKVIPGRAGEPPRVETSPPVPVFEIENLATTQAPRRGRRSTLKVYRAPGSHRLRVTGTAIAGRGATETWITVEDPLQYFGGALRTALADAGVAVEGRLFRASGLPLGPWRRVATARSDLLTTLEVVNKRSQNFYAESVFKLLGAEHCDQGTWAGGRRAVGEFLAEVGIEPGTYELADGSGMSRGNRFTTEQVTLLLRHMYFHRWGEEFLRTLPASGERDLRWKRRLAEPPYRGNVFAKTGTLNGVSTLSGYAQGTSGRLYAFSILLNETRSNWRAVKAQDSILRALVDHG